MNCIGGDCKGGGLVCGSGGLSGILFLFGEWRWETLGRKSVRSEIDMGVGRYHLWYG